MDLLARIQHLKPKSCASEVGVVDFESGQPAFAVEAVACWDCVFRRQHYSLHQQATPQSGKRKAFAYTKQSQSLYHGLSNVTSSVQTAIDGSSL